MPRWLDTLGSFIERTAGFWQKLGDLESSAHRDALDAVAIDRPLYVAGVARSGSTILLELLAGQPGSPPTATATSRRSTRPCSGTAPSRTSTAPTRPRPSARTKTASS